MNGTSSMTTTTDGRGRASAGSIQFNQQAGPMEIRVAASYAGQTASGVINQTNVAGAAVSGGGSSGGGLSTGAKVLIIVAIVAVGAGVGAYFATRSTTPAAPTIPTVTITAGTPTIAP